MMVISTGQGVNGFMLDPVSKFTLNESLIILIQNQPNKNKYLKSTNFYICLKFSRACIPTKTKLI